MESPWAPYPLNTNHCIHVYVYPSQIQCTVCVLFVFYIVMSVHVIESLKALSTVVVVFFPVLKVQGVFQAVVFSQCVFMYIYFGF